MWGIGGSGGSGGSGGLILSGGRLYILYGVVRRIHPAGRQP